MSKYDPLRDYLHAKREARWYASFAEIEAVLSFRLPNSAYKYPTWWANETEQGSHVQARAWLDAGWRTEDLDQHVQP